jgi:hypothetical protein
VAIAPTGPSPVILKDSPDRKGLGPVDTVSTVELLLTLKRGQGGVPSAAAALVCEGPPSLPERLLELNLLFN